MKTDVYRNMCTGCGLCHSIKNVDFDEHSDGFPYPRIDSSEESFCESVCPSGKNAFSETVSKLDNLWGEFNDIFLGWSSDENIRYKASSGGGITSTCLYLIEAGLVDGIIQTSRGEKPYSTKTTISRTRDEIIDCSGSRYSISTPLYEIKSLIKKDEKYAFVGKPCDVSALRMYMKQDKTLASQIIITISFFCAGQPSNTANLKLLSSMGCTQNCKSLVYRGNGWPGYAIAKDESGEEYSMTYEKSWGTILGRDIRPFCRWCIDGIGLLADLAFCDAWYIKEDGTIDFSEHDGRNVIIARTNIGLNAIKKASEKGYVHLEEYKNYKSELPIIQRYQVERKAFMYDFYIANKSLFRKTPNYSLRELKPLKKYMPFNKRIKRLFGTYLRIIKGRI